MSLFRKLLVEFWTKLESVSMDLEPLNDYAENKVTNAQEDSTMYVDALSSKEGIKV